VGESRQRGISGKIVVSVTVCLPQVQPYRGPLPQYTTPPRVPKGLLTSLLRLTQMGICISRSHSLQPQHAFPMRTAEISSTADLTKRQIEILVVNIIISCVAQGGNRLVFNSNLFNENGLLRGGDA